MQEALSRKAARFAFSSIGTVAPEPMAALAERLYFSPRRRAPSSRERALLEGAQLTHVDTPAGALATWRFQPWFPWERAERGTVLLAHGWEGRASQLASFVEPLLARGFAVVAADAPAHGLSPGDDVDLPMYAASLRAVADHCGDVRAVIAHSFGCAAATIAISDGLDVDAAVLLAPPCSLERFASEFARLAGLTRATEAIFRARLDERFGKDWSHTFALDERAHKLAIPALLIHDADDAEVPLSEARALADAWPGAKLVVTEGLGHHRVLRDAAVIEGAASFIADHVDA